MQAQSPLDADAVHWARPNSSAELHVVVIGRFTAEKGQHFAIEVTAQLAQLAKNSEVSAVRPELPVLHLHLLGSGPLEGQLVELARRLNVPHNVHFHGYRTNPYPLLSRCQLAFVPSQYEGFPNVALEALALGVPLMMTDYGPTARHILGVGGERGQLIAPGDHAGAIAGIIDCWQHPERWSSRAVAGQAWVEREHSLDGWMQAMSDLLERVHTRALHGGDRNGGKP